MTADPKPTRELDESDAAARLDFRVAVLATDQRCLVHDDETTCDPPSAAHHVVTQQQLRHAGRADVLWDPRNGMTVCARAHRLHHSGESRIPLARVPRRCVEFARENGFLDVLDRYYAA